MMDQFLRPAKSQSKWYGLSSDHKADPSAVSTWYTDACKLSRSYSRISRQSGLTSTYLTFRRISQETLRRWEKSAREATVIWPIGTLTLFTLRPVSSRILWQHCVQPMCIFLLSSQTVLSRGLRSRLPTLKARVILQDQEARVGTIRIKGWTKGRIESLHIIQTSQHGKTLEGVSIREPEGNSSAIPHDQQKGQQSYK